MTIRDRFIGRKKTKTVASVTKLPFIFPKVKHKTKNRQYYASVIDSVNLSL